jgi:CMP-N-acetylneuraminic acid synthetase
MAGRRVVAVVPARSGSQGLENKNVLTISGKSLLARAIEFGLRLEVSDVIVSTDDAQYAALASTAGATVLGLRNAAASNSTAMEPDIIDDLNEKFVEFDYSPPEIVVWIRPTFVFRSLSATRECIFQVSSGGFNASRVVTRVDPRRYSVEGAEITPLFDTRGASMVQRQGMQVQVSVFNIDVFKWPSLPCPQDFLGSKVGFAIAPKLCGVDIDSEEDFEIAEALLSFFGDGILP